MGEEQNSGAAASTSVNIDFKEINEYLKGIGTALTPTNKTIIRNCALTLFTNTNFDSNQKSPIQIAKECVDRALIIANELQKRNLLVD